MFGLVSRLPPHHSPWTCPCLCLCIAKSFADFLFSLFSQSAGRAARGKKKPVPPDAGRHTNGETQTAAHIRLGLFTFCTFSSGSMVNPPWSTYPPIPTLDRRNTRRLFDSLAPHWVGFRAVHGARLGTYASFEKSIHTRPGPDQDPQTSAGGISTEFQNNVCTCCPISD